MHKSRPVSLAALCALLLTLAKVCALDQSTTAVGTELKNNPQVPQPLSKSAASLKSGDKLKPNNMTADSTKGLWSNLWRKPSKGASSEKRKGALDSHGNSPAAAGRQGLQPLNLGNATADTEWNSTRKNSDYNKILNRNVITPQTFTLPPYLSNQRKGDQKNNVTAPETTRSDIKAQLASNRFKGKLSELLESLKEEMMLPKRDSMADAWANATTEHVTRVTTHFPRRNSTHRGWKTTTAAIVETTSAATHTATNSATSRNSSLSSVLTLGNGTMTSSSTNGTRDDHHDTDLQDYWLEEHHLNGSWIEAHSNHSFFNRTASSSNTTSRALPISPTMQTTTSQPMTSKPKPLTSPLPTSQRPPATTAQPSAMTSPLITASRSADVTKVNLKSPSESGSLSAGLIVAVVVGSGALLVALYMVLSSSLDYHSGRRDYASIDESFDF